MKKKKRIWIAALVCAWVLLVGAVIGRTVWENITPEVTAVTVTGERLPSAFSGFRIAQISDLHNATFGRGNRKLLALLADSRPDIIVITGDFVDSRHTDMDTALHFAEEAVKIAPTYYVSGNHEARMETYGDLCEALAQAGVTVLEDRAVTLEKDGETVRLAGLADPSLTLKEEEPGEVQAMVSARLESLTGGEADGGADYTILLSHRPELLDTYASCGVDLVLSGHVHGGQFRIPFVGGLFAPSQGFFPQYDAGLYRQGATAMVVSRGLGNSIIPIRINNRPELVLVELAADE